MKENEKDNSVEQVILVAVSTGDEEKTMRSLSELEELAKTAGAVTLFKVIQNRESFHPGTYIGKGKIDEIRDLIDIHGATGIICDDELSPSQLKNLEDELHTKVIDRTILILDIFAQRATTAEGKIQVELAQLKYRMTRLSGKGVDLSRLGGGIGTRGPGETKLETDRRRIRARVGQLNSELKDVVRHREVTRKSRDRNRLPVFAIVGYTNAGKSTLLNLLTSANVLSEDKLFATLDPTTRSYTLSTGEKVLLTDTVGFINKLPHHLVEAFKSTLEEAKYSDYIIHVVDSSNPDFEEQMRIVYETLDELKVSGKTIITLLNKSDVANEARVIDSRASYLLRISAKNGKGIDKLEETISSILKDDKIYIEHVFAFNDGGLVQLIRTYGNLISEEYTENGIKVSAYVTKELFGKLGISNEKKIIE